MVREINEKEFDEVIKEGKVLVDCYATWCGPCQMLSPVIEELSLEVKDYNYYKLDVDENNAIASKYGIMSIPTLLLFENGKLVNTLIGFKSKEELLSILN